MSSDFLPPLPPPPPTPGQGVTNFSTQRANPGNGPFGLQKGLRKEDIDGQLVEVKPCIYQTETLPKKHSAFSYYFLQISPVQGLAWVKSVGNTIATNPYGGELRSAFDDMKSKLEKIYGKSELIDFLMYDSIWNEPRDWMQAVNDGERRLAAKWQSSSQNSLPSDLESIFLYVAASDTYSGYIAIEYAFNNYSESEQEIAMQEDDAL